MSRWDQDVCRRFTGEHVRNTSFTLFSFFSNFWMQSRFDERKVLNQLLSTTLTLLNKLLKEDRLSPVLSLIKEGFIRNGSVLEWESSWGLIVWFLLKTQTLSSCLLCTTMKKILHWRYYVLAVQFALDSTGMQLECVKRVNELCLNIPAEIQTWAWNVTNKTSSSSSASQLVGVSVSWCQCCLKHQSREMISVLLSWAVCWSRPQ